jgi:hypothetical protein
VLGAVGRLAGVSLYGFFTFLVSIIGYGIAVGFLLTAVVKPFAPDRAGLFVSDPHSFSLGVVDHPATAHELLGWWIIPIGVIIGGLADLAVRNLQRPPDGAPASAGTGLKR